MPPMIFFEPTMPADKRPQTYALDCAAIGPGGLCLLAEYLNITDVNFCPSGFNIAWFVFSSFVIFAFGIKNCI